MWTSPKPRPECAERFVRLESGTAYAREQSDSVQSSLKGLAMAISSMPGEIADHLVKRIDKLEAAINDRLEKGDSRFREIENQVADLKARITAVYVVGSLLVISLGFLSSLFSGFFNR